MHFKNQDMAKNENPSQELEEPKVTTTKKAFDVVVKKDNRDKAHIVVVDRKKYCLHGKEYLNEKESKDIITDVPDSVLAVLHAQGYSFVKKLD